MEEKEYPFSDEDLTALPEAFRHLTPDLVVHSRKATDYHFGRGDRVEVISVFDNDGKVEVECNVNPSWAGGPSDPAALEARLDQTLASTPIQDLLPALNALLRNERSSAVVQSWYYIEVIYQLENKTVRLAYPIMGKTRDEPFDYTIEAGTERVLRVRTIQPEITDAEVTGTQNGGVWVSWSARFVGFGQLYLGFEGGKPVLLGTETLGKDFAKQVMSKLIDDAVLED